MNDVLRVGIIQTTLNYKAAWVSASSGPWHESVRMSATEEERATREIRRHLAFLRTTTRRPDVVLLPELSIPIGFEERLRLAAESLEAIVIGGLDYIIDGAADGPTVTNEATIIVPRKLTGRRISHRTETRRVGKTYPAPSEQKKLDQVHGGPVAFRPNPVVWIFESPDLGSFGVAVCYDFLDLNRLVLYRGRIQTLFILAYNPDTTSFHHIAEAVARTVFCNVVVCNCGFFGGSLAVAPFREQYRRTVYSHSGQGLAASQVIELPLAELKAHQVTGADAAFKSRPPGFVSVVALTNRTASIPNTTQPPTPTTT